MDSHSSSNLEEGLVDTIGNVGAELDKFQRSLDTELKFVAALEQKLTQARARASAASGQAELLDEAVRKADIELTRLERATELAVKSTEIARQHAGQMTERLRIQRELSKEEQERLAKRVKRLEALTVQMNLPDTGQAACPRQPDNRPAMSDYLRSAIVQRSLRTDF